MHLALDFPAAEGELNAQTIDPASIPSPEHFEEFFEKEWIRSLFASAVEELRQFCEISGKQAAFSLFETYDLSGDEAVSYAHLAEARGLSVSIVTNQLAWARREFRRFAQQRLRTICATDEEFAREFKTLFGGNP